jgi:hypothetical protein
MHKTSEQEKCGTAERDCQANSELIGIEFNWVKMLQLGSFVTILRCLQNRYKTRLKLMYLVENKRVLFFCHHKKLMV